MWGSIICEGKEKNVSTFFSCTENLTFSCLKKNLFLFPLLSSSALFFLFPFLISIRKWKLWKIIYFFLFFYFLLSLPSASYHLIFISGSSLNFGTKKYVTRHVTCNYFIFYVIVYNYTTHLDLLGREKKEPMQYKNPIIQGNIHMYIK